MSELLKGIIPIEKKFLQNNNLFALEYREGYVFGRTMRRRILQYKPWPLLEDDGVTAIDIAASTHEPEVRFRDRPRGSENDILYLSSTTKAGLPWFLHGAFGLKPQYMNMYLRFPEGDVMGTTAVLEACRQLEVERVLIMNTDKVYGEKLGATVEDPYQPGEPYATSKSCQGFIAWSYMDTYDMDVVIPHSCNAFGYDPYSSRIFPNTIKACMRGEQPLIFENDSSIREYVYIDDLVGALK
ncbi:unnamed protein product, partial [marine sediment metagenome]